MNLEELIIAVDGIPERCSAEGTVASGMRFVCLWSGCEWSAVMLKNIISYMKRGKDNAAQYKQRNECSCYNVKMSHRQNNQSQRFLGEYQPITVFLGEY